MMEKINETLCNLTEMLADALRDGCRLRLEVERLEREVEREAAGMRQVIDRLRMEQCTDAECSQRSK